jgi:hypothetical protein
VFPVAAWGTNKAAVIEVTDLFTSDPPEFSAKKQLKATGSDKARSFIENIKAFPENIETKVLVSYTLSGDAVPTGFPPTCRPKRKTPRSRPRPNPGH